VHNLSNPLSRASTAVIRQLPDYFRKRRSRERGPHSKCKASVSLIPDLNINNFVRFQRLAEVKPQQRIRLAQSEKSVRFLTAYRRKLSVFKFPAKVMRSIAFVRQIDGQPRWNLREIEIDCPHHFQNRGSHELQKRDESRHRISW
jgi:hypothetical protein